MEDQSQQTAALLSVPALLSDWYRDNARALPWRRDRDPYRVWLSEIMLQQTRVEAVVGYYQRFLQALPTVKDLANVPDGTLLKLWEGLGYYSRAKNLKKAAGIIVNEHNGVFPSDLAAIRALPGVGPYTAGAIGSICFSLPTPAVDGNVLRVVTRLLSDGANIDDPKTKKRIEETLTPLYTPENACALTQGLMELGACVCVPNGKPKCGVCPLSGVCEAYKNETQTLFPVRGKKAARKTEQKIVLLLTCDGRMTLCRRKNSGLLAGLWEFPNTDAPGDASPSPEVAAAFAESLGAKALDLKSQTAYTHIFTHKTWNMTAFLFSCAALPADLPSFTPEEILNTVALPSAFRPFFDFAASTLSGGGV